MHMRRAENFRNSPRGWNFGHTNKNRYSILWIFDALGFGLMYVMM